MASEPIKVSNVDVNIKEILKMLKIFLKLKFFRHNRQMEIHNVD